jgi:hypothetical protein
MPAITKSTASAQSRAASGDVKHKFFRAAGYDFCSTCGESLRGKRTLLETELLSALEKAVAWGQHPYRVEDVKIQPWFGLAEAAIRRAREE